MKYKVNKMPVEADGPIGGGDTVKPVKPSK